MIFVKYDMTVSDVQRLKALGGSVGSRLEGDEGFGPTVIEITAVGEKAILAKVISRNRVLVPESESDEGVWTLRLRDWRVIE